jgi:hypothetical protein
MKRKMSHGVGGSEKCHVLFEWPLTSMIWHGEIGFLIRLRSVLTFSNLQSQEMQLLHFSWQMNFYDIKI